MNRSLSVWQLKTYSWSILYLQVGSFLIYYYGQTEKDDLLSYFTLVGVRVVSLCYEANYVWWKQTNTYKENASYLKSMLLKMLCFVLKTFEVQKYLSVNSVWEAMRRDAWSTTTSCTPLVTMAMLSIWWPALVQHTGKLYEYKGREKNKKILRNKGIGMVLSYSCSFPKAYIFLSICRVFLTCEITWLLSTDRFTIFRPSGVVIKHSLF